MCVESQKCARRGKMLVKSQKCVFVRKGQGFGSQKCFRQERKDLWRVRKCISNKVEGQKQILNSQSTMTVMSWRLTRWKGLRKVVSVFVRRCFLKVKNVFVGSVQFDIYISVGRGEGLWWKVGSMFEYCFMILAKRQKYVCRKRI